MVAEIRIYVEGGGKDKTSHGLFREGLSGFLESIRAHARAQMIRFQIIACGGREEAIRNFRRALRDHPDAFNVLLVDSEGPVGESSIEHLRGNHASDVAGLTDENCHLMVQLMESWFLADVDALKGFYGGEFNAYALPRNPKVEEIEKDRILSGLKDATRQTSKYPYHKGRHGPQILGRLDASKVRRVAPYCERLFSTLEKIVG